MTDKIPQDRTEPERTGAPRILARLTAATRPAGYGLCGCERPELRHEPGCRFGLDKRSRARERRRRTVAQLDRRLEVVERELDQLRKQNRGDQ